MSSDTKADSRKCTLCHVIQPLTNFWPSQCKCKECIKAQKRQQTADKKKAQMSKTTKMCSACKVEKPVSDFSMRSSTIGRLASMCKICKSKKGSEWYAKKHQPTSTKQSEEESTSENSHDETKSITQEKTCSRCGTSKPLDSFHPSSKAADGNQYWCKDCKLQHMQQNPLLPSVAKPIGSTNAGESLFKCNTCSNIFQETDMASNMFYCRTCKNARDAEYKADHKDEINLKRRRMYMEDETIREEAKKKSKQYHESKRVEINERRKQLYALKRAETKEERDEVKRKKQEAVLKRRQELKSRVCSECKIEHPIEQFAWENKSLFLRTYKCVACTKQKPNTTPSTLDSTIDVSLSTKEPVLCSDQTIEATPTCPGCHRPKSELHFSFRDKTNGIFNSLCVDCDSKRQRMLRAKRKGVAYVDIPDGKKLCTQCNSVKDNVDFAWKNKTKGIYEPKCKPCNAEYQKKKRQKIKTIEGN